jgi:hypothetical protein
MEKQDALEIICEQAKFETQEEREHEWIGAKVAGTYEKIPNIAQRDELTAAEKIDQIAQAIDQYQKEIENLCEQAHTHHSTNSKGAKEAGSNKAAVGDRATGQHNNRLVR